MIRRKLGANINSCWLYWQQMESHPDPDTLHLCNATSVFLYCALRCKLGLVTKLITFKGTDQIQSYQVPIQIKSISANSQFLRVHLGERDSKTTSPLQLF